MKPEHETTVESAFPTSVNGQITDFAASSEDDVEDEREPTAEESDGSDE